MNHTKENPAVGGGALREFLSNRISPHSLNRRATQVGRLRDLVHWHAARPHAQVPVFEKIKGLIVLDLMMPNGEAIRDCSFGYMTKLGGAAARIGAMGKPNQIIGKVITEKQASIAWRKAS
jgi:hypothetical protein